MYIDLPIHPPRYPYAYSLCPCSILDCVFVNGGREQGFYRETLLREKTCPQRSRSPLAHCISFPNHALKKEKNSENSPSLESSAWDDSSSSVLP